MHTPCKWPGIVCCPQCQHRAAALSEPVLSEGIKLFYQKENLIPTGISLEAVEALTDKMALGLKKCVEKFKRTWRESPHASKL